MEFTDLDTDAASLGQLKLMTVGTLCQELFSGITDVYLVSCECDNRQVNITAGDWIRA